GVDLVEQMIRVAAGEPLAFSQDDLAIKGWAIESRVYAEDPLRRFLPSIGRLVRYEAPVEGEVKGDGGGYIVRNDAGVREGDEISMFYDPMIAKLSTWAESRLGAIDGMGRALEDFHIEGPSQNLAFLAAVMDQDRYRSGVISTNYIPDEFPEGFHWVAPTDFQADLMTAAGAYMHRLLAARARRQGNGLAGPLTRIEWVVAIDKAKRPVVLADIEDGLVVTLPGEDRALTLTDVDWRPGQPLFRAVLDGRAFTATVEPADEGFIIRHRAARARVLVLTPLSSAMHERLPEKVKADTSKLVVSPMPGLVVTMDAVAGQTVREGEVVCIIEAMKMQNIIRAEREGVVKAVNAAAGDSVAADDVLVEFA
ncbi:MAG TPA: biotin/lipoyl-containing protein, partial [Caulobacteraceae bacterium]